MVKDAYRQLKAFHVAIPFPRFGSAAEKHSVIKQVVTSCKVPMLHGAISGGAIVGDHRDVSQARVNILGHSGDPESLCICEVLCEMMQGHLCDVVKILRPALESLEQIAEHLRTVNYLVIVLTKGLLYEDHFRKVLLMTADLPEDHTLQRNKCNNQNKSISKSTKQ